MKLVTFRTAGGGTPRAGIAVEGAVVDLAAGASALGSSAPDSVVGLLRQGEAGLAVARQIEAAAKDGKAAAVPESEVTLLAAVPDPPSVFLLAGNYQSHITESGAAPVEKAKINPRPFIKPGTAVIGTGDPIVIPPDSDTLDYEIEIAAVIGKQGKSIPVDQANEHVAGYVVFNDVSARSLKIAEGRTRARRRRVFRLAARQVVRRLRGRRAVPGHPRRSRRPDRAGDGAAGQRRTKAALRGRRNDLFDPRGDRLPLSLRHATAGRPALHGHPGRRRRHHPDLPETGRCRRGEDRETRHIGQHGNEVGPLPRRS